jgi:predicted amidohydrolase YtcJ
MTKRALWIFCIITSILGVSPALLASDTLLVNGHIYTGNPALKWAQAIAISGTRIEAIGSNEEIMRRKEAKTEIIDLRQRTVIPGIIDSHTHMWLGALALHGFNLATPDLYVEPKDEELLISKIRQYAQNHPQDKVLFGRVQFGNNASHTLLDRAVSDRPVIIHAPTEHTLWVNGKALELASITEKPIDDPALERYVVRDSNRQPTGVLRETAMQLIDGVLASQPFEEKVAWMREASQYLNRFGITSVTNATGSLAEIRLYAALRDRGELTVRTKTAFGTVAVNHRLTPEFLADLEKARSEYNDNWVSANLVKFFSDGAGGPPLYEPEEYRKLVLELDKRGYQLMTHSLSAAPARMVLDSYEAAARVNGPRDRRFRIEHAITIASEDVLRFGPLGVIASMQPDFCCFNDAPGGTRTNVWQTYLKTGASLAFGSDWPCTFPPSPFGGIQQSVTRALRQLFSAPNPIAPVRPVSQDERLTVEQAVDAYTRGSAYARFADNAVGTLEPGKEADLAVLTQDIFSVRTEEIGNTQVVLTMVGGKIVFDELR